PSSTSPSPSRRCGGDTLLWAPPPRPGTAWPRALANAPHPARRPRPAGPNAPEVRSGAAGGDRAAPRAPDPGVETTAPRREPPARDDDELALVDRCVPERVAGRRAPGARVERVLELVAMGPTLSNWHHQSHPPHARSRFRFPWTPPGPHR